MKAIQVNESDELTLVEVNLPSPNANEVQVKVSYAGINFMDIGAKKRQLKSLLTKPFVLGVEGSGVVTQTGANAHQFKVGDRASWVFAWGSYAESINVAEDSLVKIPDDIDDQTAAALMMQGITASHFGTYFYETRPGDVALINAASGGVGLLLTQIIKIRGGTVIGRVSSENKTKAFLEAGGDHVIVAKDNFENEVMKITNNRGVDIVYDGSGPETFMSSAKSLKHGGIFCWYGPVLGGRGTIDLMSLPNDIKIGYAVFSNHIPNVDMFRKVANQLFDWVRQEKLKVKIFKAYDLADAHKAHEDMENRITEGKLLLKC